MSSCVRTPLVTFNHGVEGSSPSALTNQINGPAAIPQIQKMPVWALFWQIGCRAADRDGILHG
jgi:hypothetical protein